MKEKLSFFHVMILTYMIQTGVVVFSITHLEALHFGTNGWLMALFTSLVVLVNLMLIAIVHRMSNGRSIFEILEKSIPKFILFPIYLGLAALWSMIGCLVAKEYVLIFQMYAFPTTSPMVFKVAIDILAFLLVIKGVYNISKASTVFFFSTIWMNLLVFKALDDIKLERLTTFLFKEGGDMFTGFLNIYIAYIGYELSLLLFPYVNKKTKLMKAVMYGHLIRTFFYLMLGIVSYGIAGHNLLKKMLFPLLDLLAYIKLPFIERVENLFYGFFLFTTLITLVMYYWAAGESTLRIFPKLKSSVHYFVIILCSLIVSTVPVALDQVLRVLYLLGCAQIVIAFLFPVILILLLLIQRRKVVKHG
ncbi:spore gernimation protein [Paenibacillus sp. 7541]|uniref:GerAB/ArcD/ProY family transporter n=1 Tax=Paenibacillus campinasensis TaxID=66347 RepID=A0ABW9T3H4_9BACL|nr:GerAB/ArcD/ProY family transporter [Paenibacillus campinasensis]MUG67637.1 GerAB/ArcD/ProY family transporter [Paenibacillus campinasensis]PAK55673.1 spore gernimation protein [Paenibacillus sp. 7541]